MRAMKAELLVGASTVLGLAAHDLVVVATAAFDFCWALHLTFQWI